MRTLFVRPIVAGAVFVTMACSGRRPETMASPNTAVVVPEGTVSVTITQVRSDCTDETRCAGVEAIRALLFVGVPGSTVSRAMVADENAARKQHASFFRQLLEQGGHARYLQSVRRETAGARTAQDTRAWTVVVNYEALRLALEKEGVLRKFGY
ncbi:MAG: hypothetical protein ACREPM_12015 [Gemmatimonadaceae bacterium]